MLSRRIILASILAASVLAAGCVRQAVRTMGELQALNAELAKKFNDQVHVHLAQGANLTLTITFINSALNDKTVAERLARAQETAQIVAAHYARIASVEAIWVAFVREQTRYVVFHYSEGLEVYGFDNNGRRLGAPEPPADVLTGYRYLRETEESEISADGLQLQGTPGGDKGLVVLPHFKVSGNVKVEKAQPPARVFFDIASYSDKQEFEPVTPIVFLADGNPVLKTQGKFEGGNTQFCYLSVAYADFRKMIAAKHLTIQLGAREYPLTPNQFAGLQKMVAVVKE